MIKRHFNSVGSEWAVSPHASLPVTTASSPLHSRASGPLQSTKSTRSRPIHSLRVFEYNHCCHPLMPCWRATIGRDIVLPNAALRVTSALAQSVQSCRHSFREPRAPCRRSLLSILLRRSLEYSFSLGCQSSSDSPVLAGIFTHLFNEIEEALNIWSVL